MSWGDFLVFYVCVLAVILVCRCVPLLALGGRELSPRVTDALGLIPPAAFAAETCPEDGKAHTVKRWEIVLEANCHEKGLRRGECSKCGQMVYDPWIGPYCAQMNAVAEFQCIGAPATGRPVPVKK